MNTTGPGCQGCAPAGGTDMDGGLGQSPDIDQQVILGVMCQAMGLAHGERRVDGDVGIGALGVPDPPALWEPQLASSAAAGSGAASRRCSA